MSRPPLGAALAALLVGAAVAACATIKEVADADTAQLERFKQLRAAGDFGAIADEEVACDAGGGAICRQLHLIKGDACFVVAERGVPARQRYGCAIRGLSAGLDRGDADGDAITAAVGPLLVFEERLMEALRERQDLARSRAEAVPFTAALAARAARFRLEHPGHPAGPYFAAVARLTEILDGIAAGGADAAATCAELDDAVLGAIEAPPPAAAGRYAANYARLASDIAGARRAVPGCAP